MPSGPKKRKAAKRKKFKDSNNSNSSSTSHSLHGESDGGELSSPVAQNHHNNQLPFIKVEKCEDGSSLNESLKVESTEKIVKGEEDIIEKDKKSKIEEKAYLVVEEMPNIPSLDKSSFLEQNFVVNGSASKDNCSSSSVVVESRLIENGAANRGSSEENTSSESRDNRVNEPERLQYSDKQPLVASAPRAMQTTSWKGCCGILELLSSSGG